MKTMIMSILVFLTGFVFLACEDNSLPDIVKGRVIEFPSCNFVNVIQIESGNLIGGSISSTGLQLENIVLVPGNPIQDSIIYFNYRFFDQKKDRDSVYCTADVLIKAPKIIITNYSTLN
jgi:hypothetical protein